MSLQASRLEDVACPTCELSLIRWRKRARIAGRLEDEYRIHLSGRVSDRRAKVIFHADLSLFAGK